MGHSGKIALAGLRRLHSTLVVAIVLFPHTVATETKNKSFHHPLPQSAAAASLFALCEPITQVYVHATGRNGTTNTFLSCPWYLVQLGMLASTHTVQCRQTLRGGYYELVDKYTNTPNPDW